MRNLPEVELEKLSQFIATFEHPGSPDMPREFKIIAMSLSSLSSAEVDYLFDHVLAIDPITRQALHFDHRAFILKVLESYHSGEEITLY